MSTEGRNKRRHPRVSVPLLVQYRFGALDEPRIDYALNVSPRGLFIASDTEHPPGTRVFIQLTTRDGEHFLQGEGEVVRTASGGCAIALNGFDDAAVEVLERLVRDALAAQDTPDVGPATRREARRRASGIPADADT